MTCTPRVVLVAQSATQTNRIKCGQPPSKRVIPEVCRGGCDAIPLKRDTDATIIRVCGHGNGAVGSAVCEALLFIGLVPEMEKGILGREEEEEEEAVGLNGHNYL